MYQNFSASSYAISLFGRAVPKSLNCYLGLVLVDLVFFKGELYDDNADCLQELFFRNVSVDQEQIYVSES